MGTLHTDGPGTRALWLLPPGGPAPAWPSLLQRGSALHSRGVSSVSSKCPCAWDKATAATLQTEPPPSFPDALSRRMQSRERPRCLPAKHQPGGWSTGKQCTPPIFRKIIFYKNMLFMLFLNVFTNILNFPPFSLQIQQVSTDAMHRREAAGGSRCPGVRRGPGPRGGSAASSKPDADTCVPPLTRQPAPGWLPRVQSSSLVLAGVGKAHTQGSVHLFYGSVTTNRSAPGPLGGTEHHQPPKLLPRLSRVSPAQSPALAPLPRPRGGCAHSRVPCGRGQHWLLRARLTHAAQHRVSEMPGWLLTPRLLFLTAQGHLSLGHRLSENERSAKKK